MCFDISHEGGEVWDTWIVSIACVLALGICPAHLPIEKVDGVWVEFGGDVDRCSCFPLIVPEGEEVDAHREIVLEGGDVIVGHLVWDLVETLFCEEAVVQEWSLRIFGAWMEGRQDGISKAAGLDILDIVDRMLLCEEC